MKRRLDAKETVCDTEVKQVQDGKKSKQTLIGAIEQIVNLAVELKLGDTFHEKARPALAYVAESMSLNEEQALVFALFIEKSTDDHIQISDFAELVGCRTVRIISMMAEADMLVEKRFIRRIKDGDSICYSVPKELVNAIKENRVYTPAPIDHLTTEQLFDRMAEVFKGTDKDRLLQELDLLVAANPQLAFCRTIQSYGLRDYNEERLLLYVFCNRFINLDNDMVGEHDWDEFFSRSDMRFISYHLKGHSLVLQTMNVLENCNSDGINDPEYYHLTNKAKEELFADLHWTDQQTKKKSHLLDCTTFAAKELFYNPAVQRQIDRLGELLDPEHFADIQQRLEAGGMRKGFACLFYGAPGTGKTETVYQLARRTGRDLMVVDVSQIKSCWVGESEKNIKAAFDRYRSYVRQSERVPILLFNEADSVLGIRQEGAQRAVEKMENSIQNIILQEMEQLDGIMIATTNLTQNLDKAFERRFLYKIEFEKPSTEAKSRIWRSMIPTLNERMAETLAERYDFSGGQIENIARKRTVDMILQGAEPSFEQLDEYCRSEILGQPERSRRKIGF
ncbi:ATP-binding protein [Alistipes sp. An66]|uniref:ATP-binding protein n=1 Tax=Alistipes sp. An66 TaxID=1965650 RepID=UPI0013A5FF6E|nr:ATP-binding protein [Alistipes sp. An66]